MAKSKKHSLKQIIGKFQNPVMGNPIGAQQASQNAAQTLSSGLQKVNAANQMMPTQASVSGMGGKKEVSKKYKNLAKKC